MKQSELISDFLTFLGAPVAAMGIMEARLEKERKQREKEEERLRKEEEKRIKKEKKEREKREKGPGLFDTLFGRIKQGTKTLVGEITSDDGEDYNDDDDN